MSTPLKIRKVKKVKTCKYCKATELEKDFGSYASTCMDCIIDFKAFKKRGNEREHRISACKLMMEELKTVTLEEAIVFSNVSTNLLDKIAEGIQKIMKEREIILSRLQEVEAEITVLRAQNCIKKVIPGVSQRTVIKKKVTLPKTESEDSN